MKLIFFGSSSFSIPILEALHKSNHTVELVISTPPVKKGRGLKVLPSAVETWAIQNKLYFLTPENLKAPDFIDKISKLDSDCFVVASYGKMLPDVLLNLPKKLPFNVHPSLLPKYRGAAPIARQILNGEKETGVTIAKITSKLDAGEIISQEKTVLNETENAVSLEVSLAKLGAKLILKTLDQIETGKVKLTPQEESQATYAHKLNKEMGKIDWTKSADEIIRLVRALNPWPSTYAFLNGKRIKILKVSPANIQSSDGLPGMVVVMDLARGICVKTGSGILSIQQLQPESGKVLLAQEFQLGHDVKVGDRFS